MIVTNGITGSVNAVAPVPILGVELLMTIEALTQEKDDTIKYMVEAARDTGRINILVDFAKAIIDEL